MQLTDPLAVLDHHLDRTTRAPVVVGFSGGGDSLALLRLAVRWAQGCGRRVLALHVNHGLQPQSGGWAALAERMAGQAGADFRRLDWEGLKPATGLAAAARQARLGLMAQAVRGCSGCVLLLGHTADDAAEADWMRAEGVPIGRMQPWSASPVWPEGRNVFHLRPLLGTRRAALRSELLSAGLQWIEDPANADPRFARSRARQALSGSTETMEAPSVQGGMPDLAAVADRWGGLRLRLAPPGGPEPVKERAVLGIAAICASGAVTPPRSRKLDRILDRLRNDEAVDATLAGARIVSEGGGLTVGRDAGRLRQMEPVELAPGCEQVWDGRFALRTGEPGWRIAALTGRQSRLPGAERGVLSAVPATLRGALPLAIKDGETLTCPILAHGPVIARSLAGPRMLAALGLVQTESQAMAMAHGEPGPGDLSPGAKSMKAEE